MSSIAPFRRSNLARTFAVALARVAGQYGRDYLRHWATQAINYRPRNPFLYGSDTQVQRVYQSRRFKRTRPGAATSSSSVRFAPAPVYHPTGVIRQLYRRIGPVKRLQKAFSFKRRKNGVYRRYAKKRV